MSKSSQTLIVNGKPFDSFTLKVPTPTRSKLQEFLDKHPNEVFTTQELTDKHGFSNSLISNFSRDNRYHCYTCKMKNRFLGSPGSIKLLIMKSEEM